MKTIINSVYLSYSHGAEEQSPIIPKLCASFEKRGIHYLKRDSNQTGYGESISAFMDNLAEGDFIIVISSASYWKRDDCLYELMSIKDHGDFWFRLLPIHLPGLNLRDINTKKEIVNYWLKKAEEAGENIPENAQNIQEHADQIREIADCVDGCIGKLSDWYASDIEKHLNNDFEELIDTLVLRAKALIKKREQKAKVLRFREDAKGKIEKLLEKMPVVAEALKKEIAPNKTLREVAEELCIVDDGGQAEDAIVALNHAGIKYLDEAEGSSQVKPTDRKRVVDDLVSILGWMLAAHIDDDWIIEHIDKYFEGRSMEIRVPLTTKTGVEILTARLNSRSPSLDFRRREVDYFDSGCGVILEPGFARSGGACEVKKMLWLMFWPKDEGSVPSVFEKKHLDKLNNKLRAVRRMADRREIYIAIHQQSKNMSLTDESIKVLQDELKALRFFYYGFKDSAEEIMPMDDGALEEFVETFLETLRKYQ